MARSNRDDDYEDDDDERAGKRRRPADDEDYEDEEVKPRKKKRRRADDDDYVDDRPYASFGARFAAAFIDGLIQGVLGFVVGFVIGFVGEIIKAPPEVILILAYLAGLVIGWLYFAVQESSESQATIGKKAMGIVVTDLDGRRLTFMNATGRYFGKIPSAIFLIGYIMALFTEKKQALHDILAGTLVVERE